MKNEKDGRDSAAKPEDDTKLILRGSEERMRFALRAAGACIWDWDVKGGPVTWDAAFYELYGLPTSVKPCYENWLATIHPDDRERTQQAVRETFEKKSTDFRVEYRITHPVKGERWLSEMGQARYAHDGSPLRLTGVNVDITERKQAEMALLASEERLRFALRGAHAGMWDWNVVTNAEVWNEQQYDLHGIARSEPPSYAGWMASIHADDRTAVQRAVEATFAERRTSYCVEYRVPLVANGERWIESSGSAIYADDWKPLRMVGVTVDITARKMAELKAEELGHQRQLALSAAKMGWWHYNPVTAVATWDNRFKEIFGVTESGLSIADIYSCMHPEDVPQVQKAVEAALNPSDPRPYGIEYRVRHRDGKTVWVEAHGLATFTGSNGNRNATSFVGTVADITARRQAEEALRDSVEFSANLIRSMQDGFSMLDTQGVHVEVNPSLCKMTGFSREELVGTSPPYRYWPPEEYENIQAAFSEMLKGNFKNFELIFMRKSGERFPVLVSPYAIKNAQGETINYSATVKDITDHKRTIMALRSSEERLRLAYLAADAGAWEWDVKTNANFWSDELWQVYGLEPNCCIPTYETWWNLVHPDDRAVVGEVLQAAVRSGDELNFEWRLNQPASPTRWLMSRAQPIRDATGSVVRYIGIVLDITKRKLAEEEVRRSRDELEQRVMERTAELRSSEERFRQVTDAMDQIFWLSDTDKNEVLYISPGYERVWGRTCRSLYETPRDWLESIHPDDRTRMLEAVMKKQIAGTYDEEYRILRPDGTERWIRDRAFPVRDANGRVSRLAGVADDITERKKRQSDMMAAIESEQQRIGRDLHDGLGQILTGAKFKAALLGQKLAAGTIHTAAEEANAIELLLDEAIEQARGMAYGMNPVTARSGGLAEALEQLAARMDSAIGPRCTCTIGHGSNTSDPIVAVQLYRIAQEAVQNALKHSGATKIEIALALRDGKVVLTVTDDGSGFVDHEKRRTGGGLYNMSTRAAAIGGALEITSVPGRGTTVICSFHPHSSASEDIK